MRKIILAIFVAFIISVSAGASSSVKIYSAGYDKVYPSYSETVVVEKDGLTGVVDRQGNTVVPFGKYKATLPDSLGRVSVYQNGNSTVYDKKGNKIASFEGYEVLSLADNVVLLKTPTVYIGDGYNVSTVRYMDLQSRKIIYESDNVVAATPFCDGYASLAKKGLSVIIDSQGKEIYTDTALIIPKGCPTDGKAVFEYVDDYGNITIFLVDIREKKRICATGFEIESETNFTKSESEIKNIGDFYLFRDDDNREVLVLDGIFMPIIEDPVYFNLDCLIIQNGVQKKKIDNVTHFSSGGKHFYNGDSDIDFYYDLNGEKSGAGYEGVTGFSEGLAIVYGEDGFIFVNEKFEKVSEEFSGLYSIRLFGDVFCGMIDGKYHFISLSKSAPVTPSTPSVPVDKSGMKNFVKTAVYKDSVFPDVKAGDWFVKNVSLAYETGLMNGKGDGFAPLDNLTVAQVITMAARLNSIYETGKAEFVQGSVWYRVYVDYCVKKGIIGKNDFSDYNRNTTRAEFVRILSCAIPESEFENKNSVRAVPDVATTDKDYKSILMFYRAGILSGSDSAHNFKPKSEITRAETAAIITRIIDKSLRVSFAIK